MSNLACGHILDNTDIILSMGESALIGAHAWWVNLLLLRVTAPAIHQDQLIQPYRVGHPEQGLVNSYN